MTHEEGGVVVRAVAARASLAVALSQPISQTILTSSGVTLTVYGDMNAAEFNQTSAVSALFDRVWMRALRRNGNAVATRIALSLGLAPAFHHLVDPTTPAAHPATIILEDFVSGVIAAGVCGLLFGFAEHIDFTNAATLVGVGFKADSTHQWRAFVHDCPTNVAPVTIRRDTPTGALATDLHRLTLIIDGPSKSITWLVDGIVVDHWSPTTPLDEMTAAGPQILWGAVVPALGDATIRYFGGGAPQLRMLVTAP